MTRNNYNNRQPNPLSDNNYSNPRPAGRGGFGRGAPQGPGQVAHWREQAEIHLKKREEQDQLFKETCTQMVHWEEQEALCPEAAVSTHLLSTGSEDPDRR
ncbi:Ff.00g014880.m01.CDS01 [Fusarium sp. VM40]|nr:Ff.00g014880.m01.CDS01 [Fusarium sp. VM40]